MANSCIAGTCIQCYADGAFAFPYTGNKRYTRNVLVRSTIYEGPLSEEGYAQLEGDIEVE